MTEEKNLFGEVIVKDPILRDRFIEPPFSVLDTKTGSWQKRKQAWISKGIASEVGRDAKSFTTQSANFAGKEVKMSNTSIFDPALCEVLYHWFCPDGGRILDPFAGGSVRGIVANYLDYNYSGIDIRQEQVDSNREQAADILPVNNQPQWYVGDSNEVLDGMNGDFDFVFSCPPYADLEVYSDLDGDISNMKYSDFMAAYAEIIAKSCALLKKGAYACFVVGEVRDKKGNYIGFVPDTIKAFTDCGMSFYNEAILLNALGTAMLRANGSMRNKKLVKVHQNVLVFRKDL
tara:strand:- start:668 stop:1534 length:867 start_codon:yes stop_codon:yes gene_type:complete